MTVTITGWALAVFCFLGASITIAIVRVAWKFSSTLDSVRELKPEVHRLLVMAGEESRKASAILNDAQDTVHNVKHTVDLYNRTLARPVVVLASLAQGLKGAVGAFRKSSKEA